MKEWFQKHRQEILDELFTLLKFQSISTDPAYEKDIIACADWTLNYLQKLGLKTELIPTSSYPLVYAEDLCAGKDKPTLLIYGHYDVQPVDPIDEWDSDPFNPEIRDGQVYARGALDNKGQLFYTITALKAFLEIEKEFPINIKFLIEGEEEFASRGLSDELQNLKEKLKANFLLVPDCDIPGPDTPGITLGARGIATMEIQLKGSKTDLHSGQHGGLAYNPNRALAELLSKLWDENGRVMIEGFYDDVAEMSEKEIASYETAFDEASYSKTFGIHAFNGEKKYPHTLRNWIRPTVEINGMWGGYTGKGFKTVIPAKASAKISCRLVPDQDPEKIIELLRTFFEKNVKKGMELHFIPHEGGSAVRGSADSLLAQAAVKAYTEVFSTPCKKIMSGGSIPIIGDLAKVANADVVMMGFGLGDDGMHAPNEHFGFDRFEKGFLTIGKIIKNLDPKK